jgi:hypothetical protein
METLALSRLILSLSLLQLSPPFSSTAAASSRTATSSCGLEGSTMETRPRAPVRERHRRLLLLRAGVLLLHTGLVLPAKIILA